MSKQAPQATQSPPSTMILEFPFPSGSVDTHAPMQLQARMHLLQPMHLSFV
jgi:hypothetical protein